MWEITDNEAICISKTLWGAYDVVWERGRDDGKLMGQHTISPDVPTLKQAKQAAADWWANNYRDTVLNALREAQATIAWAIDAMGRT